MSIRILISLILFIWGNEADKLVSESSREGFVVVSPTSDSNVSGTLFLYETVNSILINGSITGLAPGFHGFHIHENGDLGNDCRNAGSHFNPFKKSHGGKYSSSRHVGDLGNIYARDDGVADVVIEDSQISMDPQSQAYIGGLALVIHGERDDLGLGGDDGSLKTGNAGPRVGCGKVVVQGVVDPVRPVTTLAPNVPLTTPAVAVSGKNTNKQQDNSGRSAFVVLSPTSTSPDVSGSVFFHGTKTGVLINGSVSGLEPGFHGFHVHERGDLSDNCKGAGSHFNPFNQKHGGKYAKQRHVGDLGNIVAGDNRVADIVIEDSMISLDPRSEAYIGNLALVIHGERDDLGLGGNDGSIKTGNAGPRVGCGIIVVEGEDALRETNSISKNLAQENQGVQSASTAVFGKPQNFANSNQKLSFNTNDSPTTPSAEEMHLDPANFGRFATVRLIAGSNSIISGVIELSSNDEGVLLEGQISGLSPGLHGFHIHEKGELGNKCKSAGGHFNPYNHRHGGPTDEIRHVGDLGNIQADRNGVASFTIFDNYISANPNSPAYIGNLAIVVHSGEDDLGKGGNLGSQRTGNAGSRDGCGIIKVLGSGFHTQQV